MRMVYLFLKFFLLYLLYFVLYWLCIQRRKRRIESYQPISYQPIKVKDEQKEDEVEVHGTHPAEAKRFEDVKIEIHGRLTQEMIVDILTRLRVKSLIRFSALSKDFNTLFQSPNFIGEHLHFSKKSPSLFLHCSYRNDDHCLRMREETFWYTLHLLPSPSPIGNPTKITNLVNIPFPIDNKEICIVGSSNGLLCFTARVKEYVIKSIFLWNPATKQVKCLPNPSFVVTSFRDCSFGFTSTVNDYKVILIQHKIIEGFEVYSLKTGAWTHLGIVASGLQLLDEFFFMIGKKLTTTNGSTFGAVTKSAGNHEWIICFDLGTETFSKINMPNLQPRHGIELEPYEDSIALLVRPKFMDATVDLWVHNKDGNYWTKLYSVTPLSQDIIQYPLTIWKGEVVIMRKSNEKILLCTSNGIEEKIIATHEVHSILYFESAYDYVESLVLI